MQGILRFRGFSPRRVAYALVAVMLATLPMHFVVSCEVSGRIVLSNAVLVVAVGILSCLGKDRKRLKPLCYAGIAIVFHVLCAH